MPPVIFVENHFARVCQSKLKVHQMILFELLPLLLFLL